jgi:hypothetical protein
MPLRHKAASPHRVTVSSEWDCAGCKVQQLAGAVLKTRRPGGRIPEDRLEKKKIVREAGAGSLGLTMLVRERVAESAKPC